MSSVITSLVDRANEFYVMCSWKHPKNKLAEEMALGPMEITEQPLPIEQQPQLSTQGSSAQEPTQQSESSSTARAPVYQSQCSHQ
jgi:hypothetical protein